MRFGSRLKVCLAEFEGRQAMVRVFLQGPVDKVAVRWQNGRVEMRFPPVSGEQTSSLRQDQDTAEKYLRGGHDRD